MCGCRSSWPVLGLCRRGCCRLPSRPLRAQSMRLPLTTRGRARAARYMSTHGCCCCGGGAAARGWRPLLPGSAAGLCQRHSPPGVEGCAAAEQGVLSNKRSGGGASIAAGRAAGTGGRAGAGRKSRDGQHGELDPLPPAQWGWLAPRWLQARKRQAGRHTRARPGGGRWRRAAHTPGCPYPYPA